MKRAYRIAVVQAKFPRGNTELNTVLMRRFVDQCMKQYPDVQLVLFPELAATGYFLSESLRNLAQPGNGNVYQLMAKAALQYGIYIGYGYVETGIDGCIYNSFQLIGRDGGSVANYRKIHLTPLEVGLFEPGDQVTLVQTDLGKIGMMICWDIAFPEMSRLLAVQGANLIIVPSAWEKPYDAPFCRFAMSRALDNTVFLAINNHIGKYADLSFFGKSQVFAPDGSSIAAAGEDVETILIADIDYNQTEQLQSAFYTMMNERRTDLYDVIWKKGGVLACRGE
ncbi:MAG: carbon-nitrogen hydrolase family protein [Brevibacillus sp.]|nr:carbon-nitrogen hydrolase family protein [Brevibacillus sp.]